jgi:hypothetical protein
MGSDPVVGAVAEAVGVMTDTRVLVGICVSVVVGPGVNVFVRLAVGVEVAIDVRVDMFVGAVVVDVDPLVVMTN